MFLALLVSCADEDDTDPEADTDADTTADTTPAFVDPGYTGFTASSRFLGERSGDPWCDVTVAITGTRDDTLCRDCDFAFDVASVPAFAAGEGDCLPPILATMAADAGHLDPFLGYAASYTYIMDYTYEREAVWYLAYTRAYTRMDVEGTVKSHVDNGVTRLMFQAFLTNGPRLTISETGFRWAPSGVEWNPARTPLLWTACSDQASTSNIGAGILGAAIEEDLREFESNADRWVLPLTAGARVSIAVDAVHDNFPGARIYVARPDGCLGLQASAGFDCSMETTSTCPATSFLANVSGDWHVVVTEAGVLRTRHSYRLGIQVDGVDVAPTLVDDDATLYDDPTYIGEALMEGVWLR
ncbi:MAG: hypothetical protein Q8P18_14395 [Pseudomonadota bacterium]|nr:hypothetical protein [Pseudomonadota bacterium]